jgi:PhnB protein
MTIVAATPYLILDGRADRALDLYKEALGARVENLQRFGDVDASCPKAQRDRVMHAALRIGEALLMLSDGDQASPPAGRGAVSVALDFDDEAELRKRFEALAASGKSIAAPFDAPWGAVFGVAEDELGVHWMLNCTKSKG